MDLFDAISVYRVKDDGELKSSTTRMQHSSPNKKLNKNFKAFIIMHIYIRKRSVDEMFSVMFTLIVFIYFVFFPLQRNIQIRSAATPRDVKLKTVY